jgi:UDP-GlcNAc:undecaprenyl-phosphate GlcNAc-1-phosphate transferase
MTGAAIVFLSFSAVAPKDNESQNRTTSREAIDAGRLEFKEHPRLDGASVCELHTCGGVSRCGRIANIRVDHSLELAGPVHGLTGVVTLTSQSALRMLLFVCACVLPSFWVSFAAVGAMRWIAPRLGLIDKPAARKVHLVPKPMGGGIGLWCGVLIPLTGALLIVFFAPELLPVKIPGKTISADGSVLYRLPQLLAVTLGALAMGLVGLADDFRPLPWQPRLLLQFLISAIVVACGVRATFFVESFWLGAIASVLWFVVLVNSINFLDNMDGLAGGIGLIVSGVFACMMLSRADDPRWMVGGYFLLLCGSLLGFLCHNWSPARIFMGDAGSYFLGFSLASMTILGTFYTAEDGRTHTILAPLCVLAVPLYDLLSVISIRLKEGRSPFQPDKKHFSHRLVALGLKPVHAVLTVHLATLTTGLAGLLLCSVDSWGAALLCLGIVVCILAMIAILESAPRPAIAGSSLGTIPVVAMSAAAGPEQNVTEVSASGRELNSHAADRASTDVSARNW